MTINNDEQKELIALHSDIEFENAEGETPEVTFQGYSGAPVNLADYGFDHPVAYDLDSMEIPNTIPILYKHYDEIGHTESVKNTGSQLTGQGKLSVSGPNNSKVKSGLKNGFPYQGSMGLSVPDIRTAMKFYKNGESVQVNGRKLNGPVYVVRNSVLREMTVTPFGRDSNTSFKSLNEDDLMRIKNESGATVDPPEAPEQVDNQATTPETPVETPVETVVENETEKSHELPNDVTLLIRTRKLINSYPEDVDLIENGLQEGWDNERIEQAIQLRNYERKMPKPVPKEKGQDDSKLNLLEARIMNSYGVSIEKIQSEFGEKIANQVADGAEMTPCEQLVECARLDGQSFTGHSDAEEMCAHFRNSGFSTLDLPNLLRRTARTMLEERWALNPPFAVSNLKVESNRDFRKTERRRITGGELWDNLDEAGKLKHYTPGKDTYYQTELDTVGKLFMITREDIVNDDLGALSDMMDAMIEGAMMVPDIKLGKLLLGSSSFWVTSGAGQNSYTSTALTRANLTTLYNAARQYNEDRGHINWNTIINGRWKLITSVPKEETAWEIIKQDRIVNDTTSNTKTGSKNYWYNRFDLKTFAQMSNSIMGSGTFVSDNTFFLWPSEVKYSPYVMTVLRGRRRPTIENVNLPGDMLGRGIRGYWDVEVNERYNTAIIRSNG